mmetsp:Transcript_53487/g.150257  ORF Transcript_53487/g.150257 Transcript_53487/m.150257 type:complete len:358 (+) Transcript_53487:1005-2078(+)
MILATKFTGWIDSHTHLIGRRTHPETHIGIKDFFGNQLEPFSCQSTGIDSHFTDEFKSPQFPQIFSGQTHDGIDGISQEVLSSYIHSHVPFVPFDTQLGTSILEPLCLFVKILDLRLSQIRVRDQIATISRFDLGVSYRLTGGYQGQNARSDSRIVSRPEFEFTHICGLFHMEAFVQINITIVVHANPLELKIGRTDGTSPTILVVFQLDLCGFVGNLWLLSEGQRQFESNSLSGSGIRRTRDQYTDSSRQQGKRGARLDSLGDFDFKELSLFFLLGFGRGPTTAHGSIGCRRAGDITRRRWRDDPHRHTGASIGRASDHQLLPLNGNGELRSTTSAVRDGDHVGRWTASFDTSDIG